MFEDCRPPGRQSSKIQEKKTIKHTCYKNIILSLSLGKEMRQLLK